MGKFFEGVEDRWKGVEKGGWPPPFDVSGLRIGESE
jgi:hypothetical protein